ncbi:MAG: hypothetical protein KA479_02005 [Saprospiraceae bacterium]|jgi:hypothetical protein|nr:hypothetical protein [Saprospiraceae bacterium]
MNKTLFEQLNESDIALLLGALPRIAILVGSADGDFDQNERDWAKKLVQIRAFKHPEVLEGLYENLETDFETTLNTLTDSYPTELTALQEQITAELLPINGILEKLDISTANVLYDSLKSFAWHISRSSGGFLGIGAISKEEEKWVSLPMISPPPPISDEEE